MLGILLERLILAGRVLKRVQLFHFINVTLSGRYPTFWGKSEANTGWLVCDGGSDLHGGNVPNLSNRFIMGVTSVSAAKKTGGSTTTSSTSTSGTIGATTITSSTSGSHSHIIGKYSYGNGRDMIIVASNVLTNNVLSINLSYTTYTGYKAQISTNIADSRKGLVNGQLATNTTIPTFLYSFTNITSQSNITTGTISGGSGSHTQL